MDAPVPSGRVAGVSLVLAAAIIWGTLGLTAKYIYEADVSFQALVAARAVGAFVFLLGFVLLSGRAATLRASGRDFISLVPLGIVSIGCFYLLYFYTVQESEVGTAAVLLYSSPAFVVILARIFLKERLTLPKLSGLMLTATGILLVIGITDITSLDVRPLIILTGLGSRLTYGLFSVVGKPLTRRLSSNAISIYMLGIGAVILTIVALPTLDTLYGLQPYIYLLIAVSAVIQTAAAYALYTAGLARLEAGQAAIAASIEPVVAGLVGAVFLAEELTTVKITGALLVVFGAVLAQASLRPTKGSGTIPGEEPRPR